MAPRASLVLRWLVIFSLATFVGLLAYGLTSRAADDSIAGGLAAGKPAPAPEFELEVLHRGTAPAPIASALERAAADGRIALSELRGMPVVLNVWASWCDPCRSEAPLLERTWKRVARDGVVVLGLDSRDARPAARRFLREFSITYPNVREAGGEISRRFGATGLPETFFIDADGRVVARAIGELDARELDQGVASALRRSS